jgi:hypothetical protein
MLHFLRRYAHRMADTERPWRPPTPQFGASGRDAGPTLELTKRREPRAQNYYWPFKPRNGGFLAEPTLLGFAYDREQEMQARQSPGFAGQVPPEPQDAGLCDASLSTSQLRTAATSVNERALRQL